MDHCRVRFVKLSEHYINLEHVSVIAPITDGGLGVWFLSDLANCVELSEADAALLLAVIDRIALTHPAAE